jgi:hypothetical protein
MVKHLISPNFEYNYISGTSNLEKKIDVFEDQINGWYLDFTEKIKGLQDSEYAVMTLTFHYFENIAKYQDGNTGNGRSGHYFKKGFRSVFPDLEAWGKDLRDSTLSLFWELGRCGLYHASSVGNRITINDNQKQVVMVDKKDRPNPNAFVNTKLWLIVIQQHFKDYISSIRDKTNSVGRSNFEKRFNKVVLNIR